MYWADLPDDWRRKWDDAAFWKRWHHERAEAIGCVYDERAADTRVQFFRNLTLVKGKWGGTPFALLPYHEQQVVRPFFGYKDAGEPPAHRADIDPLGRRRFRRCDLWVGKKNAKTTLGSGLVAEAIYLEREPGVEAYSCACDREQAALTWQNLEPMVSAQPTLAKMTKLLSAQKRLVVPSLAGFYQVLSAEAFTKHGIQPFFVDFNEIHAQPNRDLWDVMTQGAFASRDEWMLFLLSTAGFNMNGIGYEEFLYAQRVRKGETQDTRLLPVIHAVDDEEDWKSEETWYKANPALGYAGCGWPYVIDIEDMRAEYKKALELPSNENLFRTLRLNTFMSNVTYWISESDWHKNDSAPDPMTNRVHYGGLDLSETTDLTAYVRIAWNDDGLDISGHYWMPAEGIEDKERRDRVPYRQWARQGWITLTPGNIIDYSVIRGYINEHALADGMPREIAFDPYNARQFCEIQLPEDGFTMVPVRQGPPSLSDPTKKVYELAISGKLRTAADPVLAWMVSNTVLVADTNGNVKPDKAPGKMRRRIDGVSALVTALNRALLQQAESQSVYESRGIIEF